MKNRTIKNLILSLLMLVTLILGTTFAKYTSSTNGGVSLSVAKPIARIEGEENLQISNYYQKPYYFQICNYNENGDISEVAMKYFITITSTQKNPPLKYKMYKINSDGIKEEIEIVINDNTITTTQPVVIQVNKKIIHNYELEITYDNTSQTILDENIEMTLSIESQQVEGNI